MKPDELRAVGSSRLVRFIAWAMLVFGACVFLIVLLGGITLVGWEFVEDWPISGYAVAGSFAFLLVMVPIAALFEWARRVVANKSNAIAQTPPGSGTKNHG